MCRASLPELIGNLLRAEAFTHPVSGIEVIETHISWVILTGSFAYKIKKPVDLGFLDFSSLEKRRRACQEELRLNARLAPGIYLEVVPITGTAALPVMDGQGKVMEYAVRMREFPQTCQMDRRLASGVDSDLELARLFGDFGTHLARFHMSLPPACPEEPYGNPSAVFGAVRENFRHLRMLAGRGEVFRLPKTLEDWSRTRSEDIEGRIRERRASGFVREGHGDLHLRNLVLLEDRLLAFDCIEFNPALRWIDVINDVAFLFMDLRFHRRPALAWRFLNAWLSQSGDYQGLALLRFYAVYRAMVRTKIAAIEISQEGAGSSDPDTAQQHHRDLHAHLSLAAALARGTKPALMITFGVSGSGKTWLSDKLAGTFGAVHVRSDVERKRLFGMTATDRSAIEDKTRLYGGAASDATYDRLARLAASTLDAGLPVIVDATFLAADRRKPFRQLAAERGLPFVILHCRAGEETLRRRIRRRSQAGTDASEADLAVLGMQLKDNPALDENEIPHVIEVDMEVALDIEALSDSIRDRSR